MESVYLLEFLGRHLQGAGDSCNRQETALYLRTDLYMYTLGPALRIQDFSLCPHS